MGLITPYPKPELAGSGGILVKPGEEGFDQISSKLADKGFLVTTTDDLINWARTGSLDVDDVRARLLRRRDDAGLDAAL